MRIGELSEKMNVDKRTIDFYTNEGLLPNTRQSGSNYRVYDESSVDTLWKIQIFREIGLPIEDIKEALADPAYFTQARLEEHIAKLQLQKEERIKHYDDMIDFTRMFKQTAMIPLHMSRYLSVIPFSQFKIWGTSILPGLLTNIDVSDFDEYFETFLKMIHEKRNLEFQSPEIQRIIEKFCTYLGEFFENILCNIMPDIIASLSSKDDIFGMGEEYDEEMTLFIIEIQQVCADWIREAKPLEQALDFECFSESRQDVIHKLNEKYEVEAFEILTEVIQGFYDVISNSQMFLEYFAGILKTCNDITLKIDEVYDADLSRYIANAIEYFYKALKISTKS